MRMNWAVKGLIVGISSVLFLSQPISAKIYNVEFEGFKVTKLLFFEGPYTLGKGFTPVFSQHFPKSKARFIRSRFYCDNFKYQKSDQKLNVKWIYYRSNGTVYATMFSESFINSQWRSSMHTKGRGWNEPGHWTPGTYKVEILVDDKLVADDFFTIFDDSEEDEVTARFLDNVSVQSSLFFEDRQVPISQIGRVYTTHFPRSSTRYVHHALTLKNVKYGKKDQTLTVKTNFYYPNGEKLDSQSQTVKMSSYDKRKTVNMKTGHDRKGQWLSGTYVCEVIVNGSLLEKRFFTIFDDDNL